MQLIYWKYCIKYFGRKIRNKNINIIANINKIKIIKIKIANIIIITLIIINYFKGIKGIDFYLLHFLNYINI